MQCEIIEGKLVVVPGTDTERWAFDQFLTNAPSLQRVGEVVVMAPAPCVSAAPCPPNLSQKDEDAELDAIFGPI